MTSTPRVDVVILTWNDGELLQTAVDSALAQRDVDVQVIVVDNASEPPATVDDRRVQLLRNAENLGVGGGRNVGARAGRAPFVCFLDSDARLHPGALARLLEPMRDDPRVALTAPVFDGQRPEASAGVAPTIADKVRRALNRTDVYRPTPNQGVGAWWAVDFAIGACQLVRRSAYEAVGGLDDSARFGPEDVDFCLRLRGASLGVVQVAGVGCEHPPRRAFRGVMTAKGLHHSRAVVRYLWQTRRVRREVRS
jgi:N-acetylglucosaminyl-diphospho-decaprenol L-rhamnosyltransferase